MHFTWFDDALYNLADDPGERCNLIDEPGAWARLTACAPGWRRWWIRRR